MLTSTSCKLTVRGSGTATIANLSFTHVAHSSRSRLLVLSYSDVWLSMPPGTLQSLREMRRCLVCQGLGHFMISKRVREPSLDDAEVENKCTPDGQKKFLKKYLDV